MTENFKGDNQQRLSSIRALMGLDKSGALTSPEPCPCQLGNCLGEEDGKWCKAQPSSDLERPEVVGYLLAKGNGTLSIWRAGSGDEPLMTVAQHAGIIAKWADLLNRANDRADALEHRMVRVMTRHFAEELRSRDTGTKLDGYLSAGIAEIERERDAALEELSACTEHPGGCGYWREAAKRREQERDAARARVTELEAALLARSVEYAYARDAAAKGDAARQQCGGMEMEIQELREEVAAYEEGMRSLASQLGAGGFNAEKLSAAQLVEKIQWGVDNLAETQGNLLDEVRAEREAARAEWAPNIDAMVSRFLSWKLPDDFSPDCGISFTPLGWPNGWPIGTNLFTAIQAKAMLEHVIGNGSVSHG